MAVPVNSATSGVGYGVQNGVRLFMAPSVQSLSQLRRFRLTGARPLCRCAHRHARGHRNSPPDCCYPDGLPCSSLSIIVEQKKQGKKPCFLYWSGLRDSPGALLRAPARTRAPQQSPGLLLPWRVALFESRNIVEQKKQGKKPCFLCWSGLRDSNSLPPPWQGGALPDELNPQTIVLLYPAGAGLSSPFFADGNKKCRPLVGITIGTTTYR